MNPSHLSTICFPWALVSSNGTIQLQRDGLLFKSPLGLPENAISDATSLGDGGWGVCRHGYAIHKYPHAALGADRLIIHSLKIDGLATARGKIDQISVWLTKDQISEYLNNFFQSLEQIDEEHQQFLRRNIHEIRGINSALYHSALNASNSIEQILNSQSVDGLADVAQRIKSAESLSELISGRIDFMDYFSNPLASDAPRHTITAYKKVDRVQRSFRALARNRNIRIHLSGASQKTIFGPKIFDLAPYLLLDNAVKYSPDGQTIDVTCHDTENYVCFSVESIGPEIKDEEKDNIFKVGYRGDNAAASKIDGSGFGLSALKTIICDIYRGTIDVVQSKGCLFQISGINYTKIKFEVKVPNQRTIRTY